MTRRLLTFLACMRPWVSSQNWEGQKQGREGEASRHKEATITEKFKGKLNTAKVGNNLSVEIIPLSPTSLKPY